MSELRQNILTENWTVMAPERGRKPAKLIKSESKDIRDYPEYDESCPFCPGNEERFPNVIVDEIVDGNGNWLVRTIENKYKIFDDFESCPAEPEPFHKHGVYSHYKGCGNHYLVIENRIHNRIMGEMEVEDVYNIFVSYSKATSDLKQNPNNFISVVFKNQGPSAGGSQPHSHSQIVGSRIVPGWIRSALHAQERYFDTNGACPMCALMNYERGSFERIVAETDQMMILSPYAAARPYEIWVIPRRHFACYNEMSDLELRDLAAQVKKVLHAYIEKLENPDFNYFIHSAPNSLSKVPYYHAYVRIVPRMGTTGGFEMGTRIPVNSVLPEDAVDIFR